MRKYFMLAARLLFALYFSAAVYNYLNNYSGTLEGMASVGVPIPEVLLPLTILLFVAGVISLLVGFKTPYFAGALAVAMVVITLFYHSAIGEPLQLRAFISNLAVIAGLLMLVGAGPGPIAVDHDVIPAKENTLKAA